MLRLGDWGKHTPGIETATTPQIETKNSTWQHNYIAHSYTTAKTK